MSITLAESLLETKDLMHSYAGLATADSVLRGWLSQGQKDTAALTLSYQRTLPLANTDAPQALMAGQRAYPVALPIGAGGLGLTDHLKTLHILLNGLPLFLQTPTMIGRADVHTTGPGTPHYYYEFAEALTFVPYPNAAFLATTFTIELVYGASPADWTSGESVLPAAFERLPIYFAATRAAIQRRHWPVAQQWYQQYIGQIQAYRLASLQQFATPKSQLQQPVEIERQDEPHRMLLVAQQRQQLRQARRRG